MHQIWRTPPCPQHSDPASQQTSTFTPTTPSVLIGFGRFLACWICRIAPVAAVASHAPAVQLLTSSIEKTDMAGSSKQRRHLKRVVERRRQRDEEVTPSVVLEEINLPEERNISEGPGNSQLDRNVVPASVHWEGLFSLV